jgi:hypothetical protein
MDVPFGTRKEFFTRGAALVQGESGTSFHGSGEIFFLKI